MPGWAAAQDAHEADLAASASDSCSTQAFLSRASGGSGISKQEKQRIRQVLRLALLLFCFLHLFCQVFERFKDQNAHEIHRSARSLDLGSANTPGRRAGHLHLEIKLWLNTASRLLMLHSGRCSNGHDNKVTDSVSLNAQMDTDGSRRPIKFSNFLPYDFLTTIGSEGAKFLALKVGPGMCTALDASGLSSLVP